jgi:hypothetical protein
MNRSKAFLEVTKTLRTAINNGDETVELKTQSLNATLEEIDEIHRVGSVPEILKKPLTLPALKRRADKDGRISVNISVSLDELMTNIEILNDIADEKILDVSVGGSLSDLTYTVIGHVPAKDRSTLPIPPSMAFPYRKAVTGGGYLCGAIIINVNADVGDLII